MNRVTITLHIDIPDGLMPDVSYGTAPTVIEGGLLTDEPPLPSAPPPDLIQEAQRIFNQPPDVPQCPQGHGPMKFVPAGTSKRTGKGYDAFWGCQNRDCKQTAKAA